MASEYGSPLAPQANLITVSGTNNPSRVGTYTDTSLTLRNATTSPDDVPAPTPIPSGSTTLGSTRPTYATDQGEEIVDNGTFEAQTPPAYAPNSWAIETVDGFTRPRDPYRNDGMIGQAFFNNAG